MYRCSGRRSPKLLHLQREKSNDNTKTQGDALGYVLLPLWGVHFDKFWNRFLKNFSRSDSLLFGQTRGSAPTVGWGPRWVLVAVRADTGVCPYRWLGTTLGVRCCSGRHGGLPLPLVGDHAGCSLLFGQTQGSALPLVGDHAGCSLLFGQTQGSAPTGGCKPFEPLRTALHFLSPFSAFFNALIAFFWCFLLLCRVFSLSL